MVAISEGQGDAALVLLKAGAETDKRDAEGNLAVDMAPDKKVSVIVQSADLPGRTLRVTHQIRDFILSSAEREGIEIALA